MKTQQITEAIKTAKLEYYSDTSWSYTNTLTPFCLSINFYKDETGKNHVEEFCYKHKGIWVDLTPTDAQLKLMYKMLNDTPYREVEEEEFYDVEDEYFDNGVKRTDFY